MSPFAGLRRATIFPILCLGLFSLSGCGSRAVTVKGTVTLPANVPLQDSDLVTILFIPEGTGGDGSSSSVNPSDKSFAVVPVAGKGLAPGKYKVVVRFTPYGTPDAEQRKAAFAELNSKYGTGGIPYTVTDEATQNILVDLNAGTITKK